MSVSMAHALMAVAKRTGSCGRPMQTLARTVAVAVPLPMLFGAVAVFACLAGLLGIPASRGRLAAAARRAHAHEHLLKRRDGACEPIECRPYPRGALAHLLTHGVDSAAQLRVVACLGLLQPTQRSVMRLPRARFPLAKMIHDPREARPAVEEGKRGHNTVPQTASHVARMTRRC